MMLNLGYNVVSLSHPAPSREHLAHGAVLPHEVIHLAEAGTSVLEEGNQISLKLVADHTLESVNRPPMKASPIRKELQVEMGEWSQHRQ